MKLAAFVRVGAARREIGVVRDRVIVPAPEDVGDMPALIAQWPRRAFEAAQWTSPPVPLESVRLLAPVPKPSKILAIGLNYADHVAESGLTPPAEQIWFCKTQNAVNGPFDPILLPLGSDQVDYEVELVAIIGTRARNVAREDAHRYVFGYCVGNDVTMRDWQRKTTQWVLGKSGDTHAPFGPWITTADEVGDPHDLDISLRVNGEVRQASSTRQLIFNVFDQIAEVSRAVTLEPGDVIFTGTPGGVGLAMKPPRFLQEGDVVECEIAKLGSIKGVMTREKA